MDREIWEITAEPRKQRGQVHMTGAFRDHTSGPQWTLLGCQKTPLSSRKR